MPNLNIPVDEELLRAIRVRAASEDKSRRDLIVEYLENALLTEHEKPEHDRSQS